MESRKIRTSEPEQLSEHRGPLSSLSASRHLGGMLAFTLIAVHGVIVLMPQLSQQGPKLVGTGAIGAAQQGASVVLSADGNTTIFGGPGDNNAQGAGWVYARSGGS